MFRARGARSHAALWMQRDVTAQSCSSPLAFLSTRLYLLAMFYGGDPMLAAHWIQHYRRVGVLPTNVRLWVDNDGVKNVSTTIRNFVSAGVPPGNVTLLAANWSTDSKVRGDKLNHRGKLGMVNGVIESLPNDAVVIVADSDEFFSFPCDMEDKMTGSGVKVKADNKSWPTTLFCGNFQERIAATGRIEPLLASPTIAEQFPYPCSVRRMLGRPGEGMTNTHKVVLFERQVRALTLQHKTDKHCCGFRKMQNSHKVTSPSGKGEACTNLGYFPHYMMHQQAMNLLGTKVKLNNGYGARGLAVTNPNLVDCMRSASSQPCVCFVLAVTTKYKRLLKFMKMHAPSQPNSLRQHWLCNSSIPQLATKSSRGTAGSTDV